MLQPKGGTLLQKEKPIKIFFLIVIIHLNFQVLSLAQPVQKAENKWFAGFVFSPDYAYRSLYGTDPMGEEIAANSDNWETPKFGITTGFSVLYQVSNNFELESGLFFSDKGFRYASDDNTIYSKMNLGFSGGIGMEYSISKRFYFRIQPEFRRILTSMAQTPIKMFGWSLGLNSGILFRL